MRTVMGVPVVLACTMLIASVPVQAQTASGQATSGGQACGTVCLPYWGPWSYDIRWMCVGSDEPLDSCRRTWDASDCMQDVCWLAEIYRSDGAFLAAASFCGNTGVTVVARFQDISGLVDDRPILTRHNRITSRRGWVAATARASSS